MHDGEGTFVAGEDERLVRGGDIVVVPPETPHGFTNSGEGPLRMTNIHVNPRFVTDWL